MVEDSPAVVIVGAGGHARVVADALQPGRAAGHIAPNDAGDASPTDLGPWLGDDSATEGLAASGHAFIVGIGFVDRAGAARRATLLGQLDPVELATVRHPRSIVASTAILGAGTFVGPGAVVGSGARLGRAAIVNSGAVVDHDCWLGDNVHVAPGAVLSGDVSVGDHTLVGVGATVRQGVRIGSRAVVGAGAAVIGDVPDDATVVGVPARVDRAMTGFLVIGLGSIGRRHTTNLARLDPDARLTFLRHRGGDDEFCRDHGARVVTDLADVIDETFDLAVLATPSANHIDTLPMLIERCWPLLVEKPVVTDVADCDVITQMLSDAGPAVRVAGFNLRHLPSLRNMKQRIDGGDLGRLVRASFVAGQWLPDWRPGTDYRRGYSADASRGGGVELDLSHEFDLARWFFGEMQVEFARSGRFSELELRSSDTALAVLAPSGLSHPMVSVALDYVSRKRARRYEVVGDRGTLTWDIEGELSLTTADGSTTVDAGAAGYDVNASYVQMLRAVLAATETGHDGEVQPLADGLASTRLALDVRDRGGCT